MTQQYEEVKNALREVIREKGRSEKSNEFTLDFSLELSVLIAKTRAVAQSFAFASFVKDSDIFTKQEIYGFSEILFEIAGDLNDINDSLYPAGKAEAPEARDATITGDEG